jgi:hypothetical protein
MRVEAKNAVFWDVEPCGPRKNQRSSDVSAFFIVITVKTSTPTRVEALRN